jgi:hypothetical protein
MFVNIIRYWRRGYNPDKLGLTGRQSVVKQDALNYFIIIIIIIVSVVVLLHVLHQAV